MKNFKYMVTYVDDEHTTVEWCKNMKRVNELKKKHKVIKVETTKV